MTTEERQALQIEQQCRQILELQALLAMREKRIAIQQRMIDHLKRTPDTARQRAEKLFARSGE